MILVLFSGGVESTALAALSNKETTLLHVEPPYTNTLKAYDINKARQIATMLNRELLEYKQQLQLQPGGFIHQINWFLCAVHLVLAARPNTYTEVWWGMHQGESHRYYNHTVERRQTLLKVYTAHYQLHPNIIWRIPLEDKTKVEQWTMIPEHIKPLVVSCNTNNNCGVCKKCQEFNRLVTQKLSLKNQTSQPEKI